MKRHKIMQVTHDLNIGGLQQVVVNICRKINRDIFDVSVLCLRDGGPFVSDIEELGIKVSVLPQKSHGTDYFSFLKVAEIFKRNKIEIIHTHNTQPLVDGTIGALLSGVKTIVHTDHARSFPDKKRYMFAEWAMSHFVYKMVGVSDHTVQNLSSYEKISPRKLMTIMNGIDEKRYEISIDKELKRKELGIRRSGPIIGLGVRLSEQKGITYLLQAMPELIKVYPEITLVIAGEGPLESDLKKEANQLCIEKSVLFVGPRLDIPELLKLFDLYVLPSLWEGLPMVILEAMAAGCPVVATDVGGNYMAIEHGMNGSLVPPENPIKLAAEIIRVLSDERIHDQYQENGLAAVADRFSAMIMTDRYEQLYLRIV